MAAPTVVQSRTTTTKSTTVNVNYPAGATSGNLVIFLLGWADDASPVSYSGSKLAPLGGIENGSNNRASMLAWYRVLDGTEGSNESFSFDSDRECTAYVIEISGHDSAEAPLISAATTGGSRTTSPNPPSRSWTWSGDTLALAGFVFRDVASLLGIPSGYTQVAADDSDNKAFHVVARRDVTTSPEDPGTFSCDDDKETTSYTIVIKAAAAGGPDPITGTLSAQEAGGDVASATGAVSIAGTASAVEAETDALTGSGAVPVAGALSAAEIGADTFAATGTVAPPGVSGGLSVREVGLDLAACLGAVLVAGAALVAETGVDAANATGVAAISGAVAAQEAGADVLAASAGVAVAGDVAAVETGPDAFAASGAVGEVGASGALAVQEAGQDVCALTGAVAVSAALGAVDAGGDLSAAAGSVLVSASFAAAEVGADALTATGTVGAAGIEGTLEAREAGTDSAAVGGSVSVAVDLAAVEAGQDALSAVAQVLVGGSLAAAELGVDSFAAIGGLTVTIGGVFDRDLGREPLPIVLPREGRLVALPGELRLAELPREGRLAYLLPESRLAELPREGRIIALPPESANMPDPLTFTPAKPAGDVESYQIDWRRQLAVGETITAVSVSAPAGLTVVSATFSNTLTTAVVSGGQAGETYDLAFTVVTNLCPSPGKTRTGRLSIEA